VIPASNRARTLAVVVASSLLATGIGLVALRLAVPRLFGVSQDLKLLQLDTKAPAFFDNVFRKDDRAVSGFMVMDPIVRLRGRPFYPEAVGIGPHDLRGFRNRDVPIVADVVTIGDSFTYGNNVALADNWPSVLQEKLGGQVVYSMAMGGWGAVQYLEMYEKALYFGPKVAIIAFYSGNDPLDSFKDAYGIDRFADLRVDPTLTANDMPDVRFPAPREECWEATFKDGSRTTFSPTLRLASNDRRTPAVRAGYAIMLEVTRRLAANSDERHPRLMVTIIPTKETCFAPRVAADGIAPPDEYTTLVRDEGQNIADFAAATREIPGVTYVDMVKPLQDCVLADPAAYRDDADGHPLAGGYRAIGERMAGALAGELADLPAGFYCLKAPDDRKWYYVFRDRQLWVFQRPHVAEQNGWETEAARPVTSREIARYAVAGIITTADPTRFGPR
jgi:lysophospholipase L1-like esterase